MRPTANDPSLSTPKLIALVGAKGGTCKTSSVAALGHLLASSLRVLMVDLDPQGSLTRRFDFDRVPKPLTTPPIVVPAANGGLGDRLRLAPGGRALEGESFERLERHLARAVAADTDIVLIDTPPALGPAVLATARVADLVVVPAEPGEESLIGFGDMKAAIHGVKSEAIVRSVIVKAHMQSNILRTTLATFRAAYPGVLYEAVVPFEVAAAEAGWLHMPVTASAPRSRSAAAYRQMASAIALDLHFSLTLQT